jgi:hypothetical protein
VNIVPKWLLPTLSEILALNDPTWMDYSAPLAAPAATMESIAPLRSHRSALQRVRAEREWSGAIAALSLLLQNLVATAEASDAEPTTQGFVLSGPLPVISHPALVCNFSTWSLTANPLMLQPGCRYNCFRQVIKRLSLPSQKQRLPYRCYQVIHWQPSNFAWS